jgi:hypothetical protein
VKIRWLAHWDPIHLWSSLTLAVSDVMLVRKPHILRRKAPFRRRVAVMSRAHFIVQSYLQTLLDEKWFKMADLGRWEGPERANDVLNE